MFRALFESLAESELGLETKLQNVNRAVAVSVCSAWNEVLKKIIVKFSVFQFELTACLAPAPLPAVSRRKCVREEKAEEETA